MANEILTCFGINSGNLGKEYSIVRQVNTEESLIKFDEEAIQKLYKINFDGSLNKCENIVSNHQYFIMHNGKILEINSQQYLLNESLVNLHVYQSTLYALFRDFLIIYKLPDFEEFLKISTDANSNTITVRNFGDLVYISSPNQILRIESLNFTKRVQFAEEILAIDPIFDSDSQVCISTSTPSILVYNFQNTSICFEFPIEYRVNSIFSINENVVFLYSQDRNLLASLGLKEKQVTYTVVFNSKVPKQIKFCEETEQLIILNKNSGKLLIFSLDEEARISKSVVFGLKKPVEKFFHLILENSLPDQAIYAGNSMHRFFMFTEDGVEVANIEVASTKILNYKYGEEFSGLDVKDDYVFVPEKIVREEPRVKFEVFENKNTEDVAKSLENCIKAELSSDKVENLVSLIAFKLEELLPSTIKSTFLHAYPTISKGVSDAVSSSLPQLQNSLISGIRELKMLQDEMTEVLQNLMQSDKLIKQVTLSRLIIEKKFEDIKILIRTNEIQDLIPELSPDELFDLGHILFEFSLAGIENISPILEQVCNKVSPESEKFTEFFIKVSNTSLAELRSSQLILESKF